MKNPILIFYVLLYSGHFVVTYSSILFACLSIICFTMSELASVEMSPSWSGSVSFAAIFLRMRRMILPERVFGRPGTIYSNRLNVTLTTIYIIILSRRQTLFFMKLSSSYEYYDTDTRCGSLEAYLLEI